MKVLLLPLSWVYGLLMVVRNAAFDRGVLRPTRVGVPVIAIGNLTAGGTGKTPLVEWIVARLMQTGRKVGVVSRGYGRRSHGVAVVADGRSVVLNAEEGGDEPVQIARRIPGVVVVVAERRVEGARKAVEDLGVEVLVLDDAYQHRWIHRDVNVLVLDARKDITHERMLPAGMRREPLQAIGRADLIVLSKVASRAVSVSWAPKIRGLFGGPVVWCSTRIASLARQGDRAVLDVQSGPSRPAFAFSGIADHEAFLRDLSSLGIQVVGDLRFPDHHAYTADDLARISSASREAGAVQLITTEKDIARLETGKRVHEEFLSTHTVLCARLDLTVLRGEDQLMALLQECLVGGPRV